MAESKQQRERRLAREHYERQQARRAQAEARSKRRMVIAGAVAGVLVVVGGVAFVASRDDSGSADTIAAPSPQGTVQAGPCQWITADAGPAAREATTPVYDAVFVAKPATAKLTIDGRPVTVRLDTAGAPCTTTSFAHLANVKFYEATTCHRLVTAPTLKVLQCGDPTGSGSGGPGYRFATENTASLLPAGASPDLTKPVTYKAGTLAMANTGRPDTNGSQFFIVYSDSQLPPTYTPFGTVTAGLDVVTGIAAKGVQGGGTDGKPVAPAALASVAITS